MPRVERTVREHPEIEINPGLALRYLVSLRQAHRRPQQSVPEEVRKYRKQTLDEIEQSVAGINRVCLEKMLDDHPINHGWTIGVGGEGAGSDGIDFHTVAANWTNPMFRGLRSLMEKEYQVGEVELEFLRVAFEAQPSSPLLFY